MQETVSPQAARDAVETSCNATLPVRLWPYHGKWFNSSPRSQSGGNFDFSCRNTPSISVGCFGNKNTPPLRQKHPTMIIVTNTPSSQVPGAILTDAKTRLGLFKICKQTHVRMIIAWTVSKENAWCLICELVNAFFGKVSRPLALLTYLPELSHVLQSIRALKVSEKRLKTIKMKKNGLNCPRKMCFRHLHVATSYFLCPLHHWKVHGCENKSTCSSGGKAGCCSSGGKADCHQC